MAKSLDGTTFQNIFGYSLLFVLEQPENDNADRRGKGKEDEGEMKKGKKKKNSIKIQERGDVFPAITAKKFSTQSLH